MSNILESDKATEEARKARLLPKPIPGLGNDSLYLGRAWCNMSRTDRLLWIHDLPDLGEYSPPGWRSILTTDPKLGLGASVNALLTLIESGLQDSGQLRYSWRSIGPSCDPVLGIWVRIDTVGKYWSRPYIGY